MTWNDDLRDAVSGPLPMRGDREERLLETLLDELEADRFDQPGTPPDPDGPPGGTDALVDLEQSASAPEGRSRTRWLGAAAATILLIVGLIAIVNLNTDQRTATDDIEQSADAIARACESLAASSPSAQTIESALRRVPPSVTELSEYRQAFEAVVVGAVDLEPTEVPVATRDALLLISGLLAQAELAGTQAGPAPAETFELALERLDDLTERDERFVACRP